MYIALDCETTGLDVYHGSRAFMVCTLSEEGVYRTWEWEVDPFTREVKYDTDKVTSLAVYLYNHPIIFANACFDLRCLELMGITIPPHLVHDVQLMSHAFNSLGAGKGAGKDRGGQHGLKPLAFYYLDIPETDEADLKKATISARSKGKKLGWTLGTHLNGDAATKADYWMPKALHKIRDKKLVIPDTWENLCETYCKGDVFRTLGLFFLFQETLNANSLYQNYERERSLIGTTYKMQKSGMHIIPGRAEVVLEDFTKKFKELKTEADTLLGGINSNSELQIGKALSDLGFPIGVKTPKGKNATDAVTLRNLAQYVESSKGEDHKVARALRCMVGWDPDSGDDVEQIIPGYRLWETGQGYVRNYVHLVDEHNRVHPSFNQCGTAWTRYSCSNPNGQNVSAKAVLPLRRLYGPPPGFIWLSIDYSQLELRIYAYVSNEGPLIRAFEDGVDFHMATAVSIYELPPEEITKEQRKIAKNTNFGIIYGAGPGKIDRTTGRPGTYNLYMEKFPNAGKFIRSTIAATEETGYVTTVSGYRLYVDPEKPYKAVNGLVQGTAGEIVKIAMIDIDRMNLIDWDLDGSCIIANIHDELLFQIPTSYPYRAIGRRIMQVMENAGHKLGIPTPVDATIIRTNWAEGEKF